MTDVIPTAPVLPTDWNDPCQVLAYLKPLYYLGLAGKQVIKTMYETREVWYDKSNKAMLYEEIRRLEPLCAAKNNTPVVRTRRAFVGGFRCGC